MASARVRYRLVVAVAPAARRSATRTGSLGDTTKLNALSAAARRRRAARSPRMLRPADGERRERHRRRGVRRDVDAARVCDRVAVDLERDRRRRRPASSPWLDDAGGDRDALLVRERRRAASDDRRHREVRRVRRRDRHRRQRRAVGQPHAFGAVPAAALEVADQDDLAPRQRRLARGCCRPASAPGRSASRRIRAWPASIAAFEPAAIAASTRMCYFGVRRTARAWRDRRRRAARSRRAPRPSRALPVIAVAHAVPTDRAGSTTSRAPPAAAAASALLPEERPRERERRSARAPPAASAAAASGGSAAAAPTDTESAARTSATGTATTCFRSRWIRCMSTGMASAGEADEEQRGQKRHRVHHRTSHQPLAARQITEQRVVERLRRVEQRVVDARCRELRRQRVDVRLDQRAVLARASDSGTTGICSPLSRSSKLDASSKPKSISAGSSTWNTIRSLPRNRSGLIASRIASGSS